MLVKATGKITKNLNDGKRVTVDWNARLSKEPAWCLPEPQLASKSIVRIEPGTWENDALIAFTFDNETQPINRILNKPKYREKYGLQNAKTNGNNGEGGIEPEGNDPNDIKESNLPQNIILYGPPGTGKTYSVRQRALELILGEYALKDLSEKGLTNLFREYQEKGHIEFVTFHQSYGYEEFIEGLRPILNDDNKEIRYELHEGIFKRIALRASEKLHKTIENIDRQGIEESDFEQLWKRLMDTIRDFPDHIYPSIGGNTSYRMDRSNKDGIILYSVDNPEGNPHRVSKKRMKEIWEKIYVYGTQPAKLTKAVIEESDIGSPSHYVAPQFVYAKLIELNNETVPYENEVTDEEVTDYVLIIDEINRGNVSKILGELITLLEPDKRLGADNELRLPLAYSPQSHFGVPPNLHILGTMNTADRSIALMDVALRRRFTFQEVMPDKNCLKEVLEQKSGGDPPLVRLVVDLFEILNKRIRFLYDRDHQIGHAYFLGVKSLNDLRLVFADRVIPLLQEYFYGDWNKICIVLGCPYNDTGKPISNGKDGYQHPIIKADKFSEKDTLGFDHSEYEDRVDFNITPNFQNGGIEPDDLVRTFLGVLQIEQGDFDTRLKELMGDEASPDKEEAEEETAEDAS